MDTPELQQRLFPILAPFSALYGLAMRIRRRAWMSRCMPHYTSPCACVSVGNIAWGGTGKTPLVEWLMHWAAANSVKAVTLSRGYKAQLQRPPVMVSPRHTAREVGDEPLMLALSCPQIPVMVDPDRRRAAALAVARLQPDLILLDDGFQHVAMNRNLDLVLLRPEDLTTQWNRVIPAGSWREPEAALSKAGAFLIKCPPETMLELEPVAVKRLERFGKPFFSFSLVPVHLRQVSGKATMTAEEFKNQPYTLVTGVGNPEQVKATVISYLGAAPERIITHPDHHRYTFREVQNLAASRTLVVCTAKDAAKLRLFPAPNIWYIQTELRFGPALWTDCTFPEWWNAWWQTWRLPPPRA